MLDALQLARDLKSRERGEDGWRNVLLDLHAHALLLDLRAFHQADRLRLALRERPCAGGLAVARDRTRLGVLDRLALRVRAALSDELLLPARELDLVLELVLLDRALLLHRERAARERRFVGLLLDLLTHGRLEDRIATQHLHARIWWESFVTFYGLGMIVQSARAFEATDPADRADIIVSVVKSAGGVVRYVVDPMKGIQSFDPIPGEAPAARLARGERILRENADAATPFGPWYAHLINFAINGTGAVIVGAGFDDWERGLISAAVGFTVGEVSLLTQPWEPEADLEEYEARFGGRGRAARTPDVQVRLVPMGGGAALRLGF